MLLSPGTTLHHNYVIDALLEETEDGALYLGKRRDTPVYIQVKPLTSEPLKASNIHLIPDQPDAQHPCLTHVLDTFFEDQGQYWVLALEVGQPWSHRVRYGRPLTVQQALIRLRQAIESLIWLMAQGVDRLALSSHHIWWHDLDSPLVLTGWFGHPNPESADESDADFNPQRDLALLLCQCLSGQITPAPTTVSELSQQLPQLSPQLLEGIQLGLNASPSPRAEIAATLTTWLQSLPLPDTNDCLMHSQPEQLNAEWGPSHRNSARFSSPRLALTLTALIAALAGIGAGTAWRFAPSPETPGTARLSPDQGFPALSNWPGDRPEQNRELAAPQSDDRWQPRELPQENGLIQPDYLEGIPDRWGSPLEGVEPAIAPVRPWREPAPEPSLIPRPLERPQDVVPSPSAAPVAPAPPETAELEVVPEVEPFMAEPVPEAVAPEPAPPEAAPAPTTDLSTSES